MIEHDKRVEELRDVHRMEVKSQSDPIDFLKKRVQEAEVLITASGNTTYSIEVTSSAKHSTIDQLKSELAQGQELRHGRRGQAGQGRKGQRGCYQGADGIGTTC